MKNSLRQRFIDELTLRGRSTKTITAYVYNVQRIAKRFRRPPDQVTANELRDFLLELCHHYSPSTLNQIVSSWIDFYGSVLAWDVGALKANLPRQSKCKLQIRAYSKDEVRALIYNEKLSLKQQTVLSSLYHAGLRVGEVCNLQLTDIQSSHGAILVRQGKGKKDRYTLLPRRLLKELREYYRAYRPSGKWLFFSPPRGPDFCMSRRSVEEHFYSALKKSGLPNRGGPHCLRHSFATHHLQDGMDIARLQKVMGHRSLATTARYLHILSEAPKFRDSPLDHVRPEVE